MNFKKIKFQMLSIFLITSISVSIIVNTYTHENNEEYSNENKESALDVFSYDNINIKEYEVEDIQSAVAENSSLNNGGKLIQYDRNGTLNSKWDKIYVSNVRFRFY